MYDFHIAIYPNLSDSEIVMLVKSIVLSNDSKNVEQLKNSIFDKKILLN